MSLLDKLGIDTQKENEVYDLGPVANGPAMLVEYGGWYHFIGSIDRDGSDPVVVDPNWSVWFSKRVALPETAFKGLDLVQLEIEARIPWVLNEPYEP